MKKTIVDFEDPITEIKQSSDLFHMIWNVRENVAGEPYKIRDPPIVLNKLDVVIDFAKTHNATANVIDKLERARELMIHVEEYVDRFVVDDLLCEILNHDLKP
jgi:hypothetical protein